jgi:transcriptional regulator with XRE-family HTH domain
VATKSIYDEQYRSIIAGLRDARLAADLTQQDVAGRLERPQSFVAKVEGYERRLDVVEYIAMCRAIGVSPRSFLPQ